MISATEHFAALAIFIISGLVIGLIAGTLMANGELLEACMKDHSVNRCVVIAIPADKLPIYKEY